MTERLLNWLTPRVYNERFQKIHLIANYSILALALALYLAGVIGVGMIVLACVPGIICFFISYQCFAWHMLQTQQNPMEPLLRMMGLL